MKITSANIGDSIFMSCSKDNEINEIMSKSRVKIADDLDIVDNNSFAFCWITDFPIFELDKAAIIQPDYGYRFAARGWMKQSAGDDKGAIADYKKALELDPNDIYTQNNLIILEEKRNKKSRN